MKKLAIIGGLSLMTVGTTSMIWHKQKPFEMKTLGHNELAVGVGGFFLCVGFTYRF